MEFDDDYVSEVQDEEGVEIYSRRAIFWFAFLAGPLFGGALLMLNLTAAGYKRAVTTVLLFLIGFDVASGLLQVNYIRYYKIDLLAYQKKMMTYDGTGNIFDAKILLLYVIVIVVKIAGALLLSRYFFNKYFPDKDYYPKSIATPVMVTIIIWILLLLIGIGGL